MNSRIVFITSHHLYRPTCNALERIGADCETIVATYDNFEHIAKVYQQYEDMADAFLVSGPSAKRAIELACGTITKPVTYYKVDSEALHRDILKLAVENRNQDFSRVVMDFLLPLDCGYTVKDFLALEDIETVDVSTQKWMTYAGVQEVGGAENAIMERILELWREKAIDLVICQYSSIAPALEALGIPYRCPFPSDSYLKGLIHDVLARLELKQLQDNLPSIIQILPIHPSDVTDAQMALLKQKVRNFVRDNLIDCVEQESNNAMIIITTLQVVRFLTRDFRICRFADYLQQELDFPVVIGYGVGATVPHAMANVQIAVREARISERSFVLDNHGNLIGPLNAENRLVVNTNAVANISNLSKRCKLSPLTLQKLMSYVESIGTNNITTQELAQRFSITIRNANRILTNLCKGGVATPVYTQTSHSRGRPVQVYHINFDI